MRCRYCHNPETWITAGRRRVDSRRAVQAVHTVIKSYWGKRQVGITVSGGEPLLQMDFVTELFTIAKAHGVHTALDTSGNPFTMDKGYLKKFSHLMDVTDLFILDLKEMDETKHKNLTGQSGQNILDMATFLSDHNKSMWIRHVLVPGLTDEEQGLVQLRRFIDTLQNP